MGVTPIRTTLQVGSMDDALRNTVWNVLFKTQFMSHLSNANWRYMGFRPIFERLMADLYKQPIDVLPDPIPHLRPIILKGPWNVAYDTIQFIAQDVDVRKIDPKFIENMNRALEREMSGYRFVGDVLGPIISEPEIAAIEQAMASTDVFKPVSAHLGTALVMASNRSSPNYPNSIKESISAVEAACQIVTGDSKATLGSAVKKLEDSGVVLHEAFKTALLKMYGYSSDAEGIRHALLEEPTLEQPDAIFMLVACSAFVNYLKAKLASKQGVV
jgi:hypothetical protein